MKIITRKEQRRAADLETGEQRRKSKRKIRNF
jgi:hypothetical protein